jgi:pyruvate dehydrogenase E2 component (dihydrolipoamide acetyltransferase)
MAAAVRMPRWGMIMEEGILVTWLKGEGQEVTQGEGIAEVESEKAVKEIEAPAAGVLARIIVKGGETVPVGALLAVISEAGEGTEAVDSLIDGEGGSGRDDGPPAPAGEQVKLVGANATGARRLGGRISPAAKYLASQSDLEWRDLPGSGPGGRIQIKDVQSALSQRGAARPSTAAIPRGLSPLRQAIARKTALSIQAPQAALCREIDLTRLLELRAHQRASAKGGSVSLTAFMIERIVAALRKVPVLNSRLLSEGHSLSKAIHMGVVVSTEGGIMVPVIRDAQEKTVQQIHEILSDFVQRAQQKALRPEELEGGTFTLSNAGPLGIDIFQALLNPPEAAILGIGRIRKRPIVVEESVVARSTAYFCLSTDHRVVDAEPAGKFLRYLDELMAGSAESA